MRKLFVICLIATLSLAASTPQGRPCQKADQSLRSLRAKLDFESPELSTLKTRSRIAAVLPKLEGDIYLYRKRDSSSQIKETFSRGDKKQLKWDEVDNELETDHHTKRIYRISAEWELSKLLFSSHHLQIYDRRRQHYTDKQQTYTRLVKLYFRRKRKCVQLHRNNNKSAQLIRIQIQKTNAKIQNLLRIH